ncbi:MAG: 2-amino-4-hydroxy-6-hydroxymethyldihydropteridine diphosphokinase [Candidatus Hydrogenedentes bacterium]|nr:2-amino-4-hydroxy-6-hydroxymethyldihydropteridine diphosphokinase [Candidatus Hydrogenedentota bacterium]
MSGTPRVEGPRAAPVFIGLGSNIEPEKNIELALLALRRQVQLTALSTFYETEPIDRPGQAPYVNGVAAAATFSGPRPLKFAVLRPIEEAQGRVRTEDRYAPRTIDLDILLYDDWVLHEDGLVLPDPDLSKRPFLAKCVQELRPGLCLPGTGQPLEGIARQTTGRLTPLTALTQRLREMLDL